MNLVPVKSQNVAAIGYDAEAKILSVQFKGSGRVYRYSNVPPQVHADFMAAESKGSFLHTDIRGQYPILPAQERGK